MRNYFPLLALAFSVGTLWGSYSTFAVSFGIGIFACSLIIAYLLEQPLYKAISYVAVFLVLGMLWGQMDELSEHRVDSLQPRNITLKILVTDVNSAKDYGVTFLGKVLDGNLQGRKLLVKAKRRTEERLAIKKGDIYEVKGDISALEEPRNPGAFNFKEYYHIRHIDYQIQVPSNGLKKLGFTRPNFLIRLSDYLRDKAEKITFTFGNSQAVGVFAAILTGDKQLIEKDNILLFQKLGLMHLFAISGLHVGIIAALILFITTRLKISAGLELFILFITLVIFAGVAGFSVSVIRASIILMFYQLTKVVSKETTPFIPVALAAFIILAFNPRYILDLGFQLTFGTVIGLIIFLNIFSEPSVDKNWQYIFVPIAAQLPILPLLLSNFHVFGLGQLLIAIPSSLLALPIVLMAFFTLIFAPLLSLLAQASAGLGIFAAKLLLVFSDLAETLPLAAQHFPTPEKWQIILFYSLLATAYFFYTTERLPAKYVTIFLILLPGLLLLPQSKEGVRVTYIDVGQGDAILIEFPNNKNILIDAGGPTVSFGDTQTQDFSVGREIVLPVLYSKGIEHLDYVIATHPHSDHIGGLGEILKNVPADNLLQTYFANNESRLLKNTAKELKVQTRTFSSGKVIKIGSAKITFLAPLKQYLHTRSDANNSSLVIALSYGNQTMLLTGDIDSEAMEDVAEKYDLQNITFLKAPHHGSKYSLEHGFLDEMKPAAIVISVGKNNLYGHPSPEVIRYWNSRKVPVYRTDRDGAIEIQMLGQKSVLKTYLSKKNLGMVE